MALHFSADFEHIPHRLVVLSAHFYYSPVDVPSPACSANLLQLRVDRFIITIFSLSVKNNCHMGILVSND